MTPSGEQLSGTDRAGQVEELRYLLDQLQGRKGAKVLFVLDGLDEITETDPEFAGDIPLGLGIRGVTWLCAGRPELGGLFAPDGGRVVHVFESGLPQMDDVDVRSMLLERLNIGKLRTRLVGNDEERDGKVSNPFVERVTANAEGLPIYVEHVVNDIQNGRFTALDTEDARNLPPGLHAYYDKLLARYKIGTLGALTPFLAATICVAREPLALGDLGKLVKGWLGHDNRDELAKALSVISGLVRRASTADGGAGYTLNHHSLRQHMAESDETRGLVEMARIAICKHCKGWKDLAGTWHGYAVRHLADHLLEVERRDELKALLTDMDFVAEKSRTDAMHEIIGSWRELSEAKQMTQCYGKALNDLASSQLPRDQLGEHYATAAQILYDATGYEGAEALFARGIEIVRSALGRNAPRVASMLSRLSTVRFQRADYDGAVEMALRALSMLQQADGSDSLELATCLENTALALIGRCDYKGARNHAEEALRIRKNELGMDHPATLKTRSILSRSMGGMGDYSGRTPLTNAALALYTERLGPRHPRTVGAQCGLAFTAFGQGDLARAQALFEKWIPVRLEVQGPHPDVAGSLKYLARLYAERGEYSKAANTFWEAIEIYSAAYGGTHPYTADVYLDLVGVFKRTRDIKAATEMYTRVLSSWQAALPADSPIQNMTDAHSLVQYTESSDRTPELADRKALKVTAAVLDAMGDTENATVLIKERLVLAYQESGRMFDYMADSIAWYAEMLRDIGDLDEAEAQFRRALEIRKQILLPSHQSYAVSLNDLAEVRMSKRSHAEAHTLLTEALDACTEYYHERAPLTARTLHNLGAVHAVRGEAADAQAHLEQALRIRESVLVPHHADTIATRQRLAELAIADSALVT